MLRNVLIAALVLVLVLLVLVSPLSPLGSRWLTERLGLTLGKPATTGNAAFAPFVGTWRLVSAVELLPNGAERPPAFGSHPQGYLMYDASGHVCAQVTDPDRPRWRMPENPTPQEARSAFIGFNGYCGSYTVDAQSQTAAHIPEVSFDPNIVLQPQPRNYRFEGDRLIYNGVERLENGGESRWTMVWEKVK